MEGNFILPFFNLHVRNCGRLLVSSTSSQNQKEGGGEKMGVGVEGKGGKRRGEERTQERKGKASLGPHGAHSLAGKGSAEHAPKPSR